MNIPKIPGADALKNTLSEAKEKVTEASGKVTEMFQDKKNETATNLKVNDSDFVGDTEDEDRDSEQLRNQGDTDLDTDEDDIPEEDVA